MFTRILGMVVVVVGFWSGYYLGTQSLPAPATAPEQVRSRAILACFNETSRRLNRIHPDPEVLASINEQCRRLYDER